MSALNNTLTKMALKGLKPYVTDLIKNHAGVEGAKALKVSFVMNFENDPELEIVRVVSDKGNFEFNIKG